MSTTTALTYYRPEEVVQNELYSTQVTELTIKKDQFHNISGNLYPKKELTNLIGSASGVEFSSSVRIDTVYGDIIENADGSKVKKQEGLRCTKQGKKMKPDGTFQLSSPCTYEFNWVDRAELDFIGAEEYNKSTYNTPGKKRKHILELKKFAAQRASTGAELMVIRELTGMPTAFKEGELSGSGWKMMFSQMGESKALQEAVAKARIDNIRNGGQIAQNINGAAALLTGGTPDVAQDFNDKFERSESNPNPPVPEAIPEGPPVEAYVEPALTHKQEFDAMLLKISDDAKDFYLPKVADNNYSLEVLQWAIADMKLNCPEVA